MFKDDNVVTDEDVGDFVKQLHEDANGANSPLSRILTQQFVEVDENGLDINRKESTNRTQNKG